MRTFRNVMIGRRDVYSAQLYCRSQTSFCSRFLYVSLRFLPTFVPSSILILVTPGCSSAGSAPMLGASPDAVRFPAPGIVIYLRMRKHASIPG